MCAIVVSFGKRAVEKRKAREIKLCCLVAESLSWSLLFYTYKFH